MLEAASFGGVHIMAQFTTVESASHQRYPFTKKKVEANMSSEIMSWAKRGCLWPEKRLHSVLSGVG